MMEIKILNLDKAIELYDILDPYLPEEIDTKVAVLDFVKGIIDKIEKSKNYKDYVKCLVLFTGESVDELLKQDEKSLLSIFIRGLSENKILYLITFVRRFNARR